MSRNRKMNMIDKKHKSVRKAFFHFIRNEADGSIVENMLVTLVGLVISLAFLTIVFSAFKTVSDRWNMQQAAREYMLLMETEGYLQPEDATALVEELEEAGLTDISLTGSTMTECTYGEPIYLVITGTYDQNVLRFSEGISGIGTNPVRITISKRSTAKN